MEDVHPPRARSGGAPAAFGDERTPLLNGGAPNGKGPAAEGKLSAGASSSSSSSAGAAGKGGLADQGLSNALAAETIYCVVSASTILFNKHALSSFQFPAPNLLLTFQFLFAVVFLKVLELLGVLVLEPMRWSAAKAWLPLNLLFVCMNASGFYALKNVSAGMFTVLKNGANLLTIAGDWYFFGKTYGWQVWGCLALMASSAALGGWTDLAFSVEGYAWQAVNCVFTAAYSLYLSAVVKRHQAPAALVSEKSHSKLPSSDEDEDEEQGGAARGGTSSGGRRTPSGQLSEMSMVYYNNVLSVVPIFILSAAFGELRGLDTYPFWSSPTFQLVALVGALLGLCVSFASMWCMSRTSATMYSLAGGMNKIIVAAVGLWYFQEKATAVNLISIGMGLLAGFLFVFAKAHG